jgi:cellulose synthase/poly-beta-1,6-N-acetylglucosamine synthase-like glycosyltransferase
LLTLWLFWLAVGWLLYAFAGYPLLLALLAKFRNRPVRSAPCTPSVSLILAVHNEEDHIGAKLDNLLGLDYPSEKLEIIVVSDKSDDRTDDIVASYADRGVVLLALPERGGKHRAQEMGIARAGGEILAFTDAAPLLDRPALARMVEYYADPEVGCVSSEDRVQGSPGSTGEERNYIRYLMALRRLETAVGSVVGLSGSFFSARRELCRRWWVDRSSDFFVALEAVRQGQRAVHHPESLHYYHVTRHIAAEFARKRRTALNGLFVVMHSLDLLNPLRYGIFAVQLFSHKVCRFVAPFMLLVMLTTSALLAPGSPIFDLLLTLQLVVFFLSMLVAFVPQIAGLPIVRPLVFFSIGNAAIFAAWIDLFRGDTRTIWNPTRRP